MCGQVNGGKFGRCFLHDSCDTFVASVTKSTSDDENLRRQREHCGQGYLRQAREVGYPFGKA